MSLARNVACPECKESSTVRPGRRDFLRTVSAGAAGLAGISGGRRLWADDAPAAKPVVKPGEDLVRELVAGMSPEQRAKLVLPWNDGADMGLPTRLRMVNSAHKGLRIGQEYTPAQQELNERILKSICNGDDGFERISRNGRYDTGGGFKGCGALVFGNPEDGGKFSWVFSGHHLTVRCDGNSEEGAAFGGPMYYGHSAPGNSENNVFNFQTKAVSSVFDALNEDQRKKALAAGSPGERADSVKFREGGSAYPGVGYDELSQDQQELVEGVMRTVLSPYRKEDADEVMAIIKANGGMEKMHFAFYADSGNRGRWHFWRIEGPGFVWNYRVVPHVHTYVQISSKIG